MFSSHKQESPAQTMCFPVLKHLLGAGEMACGQRYLMYTSNDQSSILRTHIKVEDETHLHKVVLNSTHVP